MRGRVLVCAVFLSTLTLHGQAPLLPRIDSIRLAGFNGSARFSPGAYAFVTGANLGTQPAMTVNGIKVLVVSCTGLGAVDTPVAAGSSAPMDSLTSELNPVTVNRRKPRGRHFRGPRARRGRFVSGHRHGSRRIAG